MEGDSKVYCLAS